MPCGISGSFLPSYMAAWTTPPVLQQKTRTTLCVTFAPCHLPDTHISLLLPIEVCCLWGTHFLGITELVSMQPFPAFPPSLLTLVHLQSLDLELVPMQSQSVYWLQAEMNFSSLLPLPNTFSCHITSADKRGPLQLFICTKSLTRAFYWMTTLGASPSFIFLPQILFASCSCLFYSILSIRSAPLKGR